MKVLLKECGLKAGQVFEIKGYLSTTATESVDNRSTGGASPTGSGGGGNKFGSLDSLPESSSHLSTDSSSQHHNNKQHDVSKSLISTSSSRHVTQSSPVTGGSSSPGRVHDSEQTDTLRSSSPIQRRPTADVDDSRDDRQPRDESVRQSQHDDIRDTSRQSGYNERSTRSGNTSQPSSQSHSHSHHTSTQRSARHDAMPHTRGGGGAREADHYAGGGGAGRYYRQHGGYSRGYSSGRGRARPPGNAHHQDRHYHHGHHDGMTRSAAQPPSSSAATYYANKPFAHASPPAAASSSSSVVVKTREQRMLEDSFTPPFVLKQLSAELTATTTTRKTVAPVTGERRAECDLFARVGERGGGSGHQRYSAGEDRENPLGGGSVPTMMFTSRSDSALTNGAAGDFSGYSHGRDTREQHGRSTHGDDRRYKPARQLASYTAPSSHHHHRQKHQHQEHQEQRHQPPPRHSNMTSSPRDNSRVPPRLSRQQGHGGHRGGHQGGHHHGHGASPSQSDQDSEHYRCNPVEYPSLKEVTSSSAAPTAGGGSAAQAERSPSSTGGRGVRDTRQQYGDNNRYVLDSAALDRNSRMTDLRARVGRPQQRQQQQS